MKIKLKPKKIICECGTEFIGYHKDSRCPECRVRRIKEGKREYSRKNFKAASPHRQRRTREIEFSNDPNFQEYGIYF